jgi:hypothetical protein
MTDQQLFGPVAMPTAWRALAEVTASGTPSTCAGSTDAGSNHGRPLAYRSHHQKWVVDLLSG